MVPIFTARHPITKDAFKNLVPQFPRTLLRTAMLHCKDRLMVSPATTNPTNPAIGGPFVGISLKFKGLSLGEQGFVLGLLIGFSHPFVLFLNYGIDYITDLPYFQ